MDAPPIKKQIRGKLRERRTKFREFIHCKFKERANSNELLTVIHFKVKENHFPNISG